MLVKDIDKLYEKVKTYPQYVLVLSDTTGYTEDHIRKVFRGDRKPTEILLRAMMQVAKLVDKKNERLAKEIASATQN